MRLRHLVTAAVVSLASVLPMHSARAQTAIYAQGTGLSNDLSTSSGYFWGPTFGVYQDRHSLALLHVGLDVRGSYLKNGDSSYGSGLGGIRASIVPHVIPVKVYAEALGGVGVVNVNSNSGTHFQYQVNGGVEYTVLPHLDWRAVEVAYNGFSGGTGGNPVGLSTGLVFRLF